MGDEVELHVKIKSFGNHDQLRLDPMSPESVEWALVDAGWHDTIVEKLDIGKKKTMPDEVEQVRRERLIGELTSKTLNQEAQIASLLDKVRDLESELRERERRIEKLENL
jgi:predicted RNase H-like nuclease (RuvC/YqgF family)